eukprot:754851-Hanusia_phi.AAC.3
MIATASCCILCLSSAFNVLAGDQSRNVRENSGRLEGSTSRRDADADVEVSALTSRGQTFLPPHPPDLLPHPLSPHRPARLFLLSPVLLPLPPRPGQYNRLLLFLPPPLPLCPRVRCRILRETRSRSCRRALTEAQGQMKEGRRSFFPASEEEGRRARSIWGDEDVSERVCRLVAVRLLALPAGDGKDSG